MRGYEPSEPRNTAETRVLPGEKQKSHQKEREGDKQKVWALGLKEKSSKALHSPAVLINLINKSKLAYE